MQSLKDARGLPVMSGSAAELDAIDTFTARLLRLDPGLEAILEDAARFPATPMIQLLAASLCLFGQTPASDSSATAYLDAAAAAMTGEREVRLHQALSLWAGQDHLGAVAALEAITEVWPTDLLAAKIAEFQYFVLGQQHESARFLAHMRRLHAANSDHPDFLSMLAFAHELHGDVEDARRVVERSLALEARNPWADHCVAHLHFRTGDSERAIAVMQGLLPVWETTARFIHGHNAWHLAVAKLDRLDRDGAMDLFHRHVWGFSPDFVAEQIDAIALLWRLDMAGGAADLPWGELADRAEQRIAAQYMPFLDAHYAYALARAGRNDALQALLANVDARSAATDAEAPRSWTPVGRSLVHASACLARGDAAPSARLLGPVIADVAVVGGSDAQVDLFRQAYFHALVGSGRKADARGYWTAVIGDRPPTPLDRQRLALAA